MGGSDLKQLGSLLLQILTPQVGLEPWSRQLICTLWLYRVCSRRKRSFCWVYSNLPPLYSVQIESEVYMPLSILSPDHPYLQTTDVKLFHDQQSLCFCRICFAVL